MRSSQTAGVEPAGPGKSTRQSTLSVLLQEDGIFFSELMPALLGPRHEPQLSAKALESEIDNKPSRQSAIDWILMRFLEDQAGF